MGSRRDLGIWGLSRRVETQLAKLLLHHGDVRITSGRRSRWRNRKVGGSPRSRHLLGVAVDLVGPSETLRHLREVAPRYGATEILDEGDHTHIAWPRDWK